MDQKAVFIMGIGRSGSTLLDLMIGSHSEAFSLGEISKLPSFVTKGENNFCFREDSTFWQDNFTSYELQQLAKGLSGHRINRHIPLKLEKIIREIIGKDQIFKPYTTLFQKTQKNILVDSSKYLSWIKNQLSHKEFRAKTIPVYLIYVVRDGRAVVNSYSRVYPNLSIEELSHKWLKQTIEFREFYQNFKLGEKKRIIYEDLASNPHKTLSELCSFIGINFEETMIEYWKHDHHHIVGSRGTNSLILKYRQQNNNLADNTFYKDNNFEIKLDLRWQKEFDGERLAIFNKIGGEENKQFEYNL